MLFPKRSLRFTRVEAQNNVFIYPTIRMGIAVKQ
jgi:hypothetical protein